METQERRQQSGGNWAERVSFPSGNLERELFEEEFRLENAQYKQSQEEVEELAYANWN